MSTTKSTMLRTNVQQRVDRHAHLHLWVPNSTKQTQVKIIKSCVKLVNLFHMFYRWFRSIQTTCMKAVNVHLLFNHRHKHTGIYIHQFTPQYCFHLVFQLGAPNYIDVSLYAVCFSSQLTDPYGQVPRVYIISYLMLKGFSAQEHWAMCSSFKLVGFSLGEIFTLVTALVLFMFFGLQIMHTILRNMSQQHAPKFLILI